MDILTTKPCPITARDIHILDMEHLGQGLYAWENDSLELLIRVYGHTFSIESVVNKRDSVIH